MNLLSKEILVVAIGGAAGSVARLLLSRFVQMRLPFETLPFGIMTVNVLGCFLIGLLYGIFSAHESINTLWRAGLVVGILGGFTTFSSFSLDTITFCLRGEFSYALLNVVFSLFFCLLATSAGVGLVYLIN